LQAYGFDLPDAHAGAGLIVETMRATLLDPEIYASAVWRWTKEDGLHRVKGVDDGVHVDDLVQERIVQAVEHYLEGLDDEVRERVTRKSRREDFSRLSAKVDAAQRAANDDLEKIASLR
jgi:hypothetical protein